MMLYKGYAAIVEFDNEANILHSEILHLNDGITFQADWSLVWNAHFMIPSLSIWSFARPGGVNLKNLILER